MSRSKISNSFLLTDKFVRTYVEFNSGVAIHNRKRTDWIGEGKTFFDLYKDNSTYRKNIKRNSYGGNGTMIDQDIKWDIEHGWIKKITTLDPHLQEFGFKTIDEYLKHMKFQKIGKFFIKKNQFIVKYDQKYSSSKHMIYIHVIDNEILRVGSSKNEFKYRMERWEKDVTKLLNIKNTDPTFNEGDEWNNLLKNKTGTLYGRQGTVIKTPIGKINIYLSEESNLIGRHQPIMCKDRSRYK